MINMDMGLLENSAFVFGSKPTQQIFRSFDGGIACSSASVRPEMHKSFMEPFAFQGNLIACGQGLSYAAASFGRSSISVDMRSFDRVIDYDTDTTDVVVEAGIRLIDLFQFLLKRRRYLVIQPGHGQISVGGCIAANVHGKNPAKDGTFYDQVQELTLFHPVHGQVHLSRTSLPDIFEATCGGFGLTGIILSARLKTQALPGNTMALESIAVDQPEAGAGLMRQASAASAIVYSWHDLMSPSGRGMVITGQFSDDFLEVPLPATPTHALSAHWRARLPFSLQARSTARLANLLYYRMNRQRLQEVPLWKALFPTQGMEVYFRLFGDAGFHEYQVIISDQNFAEYVQRLRDAARRKMIPICLASGKAFGGHQKYLRFAGPGVCFAINVPRSQASLALLADLDQITLTLGGRTNIIKDSRLGQSAVEASYPDYGEFRRKLREWDPARLFRSELSDRLDL